MVGQLTFGKKQWEHLDLPMRRLIPVFDKASKEMIDFIDADTEAFNDYMSAMKLPKSSEAEILLRDKAMQDGLKSAVQVPLGLASKAFGLFEPLLELSTLGNINCKSDLQVSFQSTFFDRSSFPTMLLAENVKKGGWRPGLLITLNHGR